MWSSLEKLENKKQARPNVTTAANKRNAKAVSINPALILSTGRESGQSKFISFETSAKGSCEGFFGPVDCL